ncbi:hypothetical protein ACFW2V_13460 [Streptomyces sp. NPDC058947]
MVIYVSTDDLHAAMADVDEGREVEWTADDGTKVTLRPAKSGE